MHKQLIFDKTAKTIHLRKNSLYNKYLFVKNELQLQKLKIQYVPKCKT